MCSGTAATLRTGPRREKGKKETSHDGNDDSTVSIVSPPLSLHGLSTTPDLMATSVPRKSLTSQDMIPIPRSRTRRKRFQTSPCMLCHIPYSRSMAPFSKYVLFSFFSFNRLILLV